MPDPGCSRGDTPGPQGGPRASVAAGRSLETLRKRGRAAEEVHPCGRWSRVGQDTQVGAGDRVGGSRGPGRGRARGRLMGLPRPYCPPPFPASASGLPKRPPPARSDAPAPGEACCPGQRRSLGPHSHRPLGLGARSLQHVPRHPFLHTGSAGKWSGTRASPGPRLEIVLGVTSEVRLPVNAASL